MPKLLPVSRRGARPTASGSQHLLDRVAAAAPAQMSAENFPVALRLLPKGPRADLARVYAFARFVDDVGDDTPGGPSARLGLLDQVERELRELDTRAPELAPVAGVAPLINSGRVPLQPFLDLVAANRVDQRVQSYATFDDLLGYCELSAAPVGRIVLHLAGAADPANVADSDSVCAALQVLEHCQDVAEDFGAGRVYLPQDDLRDTGVSAEELAAGSTSPGLRRAVAREVGRAREMLAPGAALVGRLHGWARIAVAGYVAGGLATADALDAAGHDVLAGTIKPSRLRTARHALALLRHR